MAIRTFKYQPLELRVVFYKRHMYFGHAFLGFLAVHRILWSTSGHSQHYLSSYCANHGVRARTECCSIIPIFQSDLTWSGLDFS